MRVLSCRPTCWQAFRFQSRTPRKSETRRLVWFQLRFPFLLSILQADKPTDVHPQSLTSEGRSCPLRYICIRIVQKRGIEATVRRYPEEPGNNPVIIPNAGTMHSYAEQSGAGTALGRVHQTSPRIPRQLRRQQRQQQQQQQRLTTEILEA